MAGMIRQRYGPSAPFSRFLYGLFPFPGGDAVPEDILSCSGSVLLCFFIIGTSGRGFLGDCFLSVVFGDKIQRK
jgi:hypothetical protein